MDFYPKISPWAHLVTPFWHLLAFSVILGLLKNSRRPSRTVPENMKIGWFVYVSLYSNLDTFHIKFYLIIQNCFQKLIWSLISYILQYFKLLTGLICNIYAFLKFLRNTILNQFYHIFGVPSNNKETTVHWLYLYFTIDFMLWLKYAHCAQYSILWF